MALSDSETCYDNPTDLTPPLRRCRKMAPKSGHVRSQSTPLLMVTSDKRPKTLGVTSILLQLGPGGNKLLSSPSMPVISVERSSLAISKRAKSLLLLAFLLVNYVIFLIVAGNTTISIDHFADGFVTRIQVHNETTNKNSNFKEQYHKHSYCPSEIDSNPYVMNLRPSDSGALTKVAIVLGITSKTKNDNGDYYNITKHNMVSLMPTFRSLLPSFCKTASFGYNYHFFFGYDINDPHFTVPDFRNMFANTLLRMITLYCPGGSVYSVHFVQCTHTRHVSWAQNDAMMEAYLAGMEYFYRVNDDTVMTTAGWTEAFIWNLAQFDPPNVGIVGPNHKHGNTRVLTYEFVHRVHMEIMGFHYPRANGDWDDDVWITTVYRPSRSLKVGYIHLDHTQELGRRYEINYMCDKMRRRVMEQTKAKVQRFVDHYHEDPVVPDPRKVISLSISSSDPAHLWGAVRNAHLRRIVYPDWTVRVYVACKGSGSADVDGFTTNLDRVLKTLDTFDVDVRVVDNDVSHVIPASAWHLLALDDDLDHVLLRNPDERISSRDRVLVDDWLRMNNETSVPAHCVRDHPSHADLPIVHGLWGADIKSLKPLLGNNIKVLLKQYAKNYTGQLESFAQGFLNDVLWPRLENSTTCHDSITCDKWNNSISFNEHRGDVGYLGRKYDQHEESMYPFDMIPFDRMQYSDCN